MKLFINTSFDARESLVVSETQNTTTSIQTLFNGDSLPLEIKFVDGLGDVDWTFNSQYIQNVKVAIGDLDQQTIVAFIDGLVQHDNNFWQGTLNLGTTELSNQLSGSEETQFHFEVQVVKTSGEIVTTLQSLVTMRNQLILGSTTSVDVPTSDDSTDDSTTDDSTTDDSTDDSSSDVSYVIDSTATLATGQQIQVQVDFTMNNRNFVQGEIFTISNISSSNDSVKVVIDGNNYWIGQRGTRFEVAVPTSTNSDDSSSDANTDSDGDGVSDDQDAFDNDASETTDSDGDGVGDNADAFDNDASETTDSDGDGVGDNADAFDNDASETTDSDGDGVGDNADAFDNDASETTDSDGDGVGDNADTYPNDVTRTENTPFYVYGDDGTNGEGFYYPLYADSEGLDSYHTHEIDGVTYYMDDSDINHAQASLPTDNSITLAPTATMPELYDYQYAEKIYTRTGNPDTPNDALRNITGYNTTSVTHEDSNGNSQTDNFNIVATYDNESSGTSLESQDVDSHTTIPRQVFRWRVTSKNIRSPDSFQSSYVGTYNVQIVSDKFPIDLTNNNPYSNPNLMWSLQSIWSLGRHYDSIGSWSDPKSRALDTNGNVHVIDINFVSYNFTISDASDESVVDVFDVGDEMWIYVR